MQATTLLKRERAAMVAFLESLSFAQWHAASLCDGWQVIDVAAHLVIREQKPLRFIVAEASSGKLGWSAPQMMEQVKAKGRDFLLQTLRAGPPLAYRLPGPSALANFVENWVHHEDLRRGELGLMRSSTPEAQAKLWSVFPLLGRVMLRSLRTSGIVALQQHDGQAYAFQVGDGFPRAAEPRQATARIIGMPGEITLFLMGRKQAAQVEFAGDAALVHALQTTAFSL